MTDTAALNPNKPTKTAIRKMKKKLKTLSSDNTPSKTNNEIKETKEKIKLMEIEMKKSSQANTSSKVVSQKGNQKLKKGKPNVGSVSKPKTEMSHNTEIKKRPFFKKNKDGTQKTIKQPTSQAFTSVKVANTKNTKKTKTASKSQSDSKEYKTKPVTEPEKSKIVPGKVSTDASKQLDGKKELTLRQKHKISKLRERRKLKRQGVLIPPNPLNEEEEGSEEVQVIKEKIERPRKSEDASSNWKQMQNVIARESGSTEGAGKKRKRPQVKIRNPKYRKVEEWQQKNNKEKSAEEEDCSPVDIWFDDVDEILIDKRHRSVKKADTVSQETMDGEPDTEVNNPLIKQDAFKGLTKIVGIDCEMVGVGDGTDSVLARVSIVNQYGEPVYDTFVKPKEKVVDYRTHVSGVRPEDLKNGEDFDEVLKRVSEIVKGRILVGHAIKNDLQVLYLNHPKKRIRDTSMYKPFRRLFGGRNPSLKKLSAQVLSVGVQEGEHNSVQDAQAAMRLYTMYRKQWEAELLTKKRRGGKQVTEKKQQTPT